MCNVLHSGMDIDDKFCDDDDVSMIQKMWMGTQRCKTVLTFLFKLTSSCFLKFLCVAQNPTFKKKSFIASDCRNQRALIKEVQEVLRQA